MLRRSFPWTPCLPLAGRDLGCEAVRVDRGAQRGVQVQRPGEQLRGVPALQLPHAVARLGAGPALDQARHAKYNFITLKHINVFE